MSVEIGQNFSNYQILEKLGEGGMGVVYKAFDSSLKRNVALKFLPANLTEHISSRKRFIVEAQAASALDHPNICNIHEINETEDGQLYICMAYYDGESLRQKIKKGPLTFEESLNIFYHLTQGLKAAHEEKIVHRDIKPGNIIITDKGETKIVDFGLAKLAGEKLTESISTKGTIAYMAPEVIRNLPEDHRVDFWSLGVVLYEMLTGYLPFKGEYPEPMMYSIVNQEPKLLSEYLNNVPELLQNIIDKLLKKDPDERYQNLSDLLVDLTSFVKEEDLVLMKTKPAIVKLLLRNKVYLYGSIAILLVILFLIIGRPYLFPDRLEGNKIAVIPIVNITNNVEHEWFSDGMTDALITNLAQISGLRVTSFSSSIKYKGTDKSPPEIASELGVQYLVEPSAIKLGDQVKVSARLLNALDDEYLWAEEYEREFKNILVLQSDIAQEIAGQIQVKLTPQEETRLTVTRQVNPETYELYLKGMFHLNKLTPEGIEKGLAYLLEAVANDPTEPLAHAGLAIAYITIAHGASPIPDPLAKAKTATLNALELDESLAEAHLALGLVIALHDLDWMTAEQSIKRALELNPNLALAHYYYGYFLRIPGQLEEGYAEMIRGKQLDPLNPVYAADLGWMYYFDGKFDESIEECLKSLDINPEFPQAYHILGSSYAAKGMFEEAITFNQKAGELSLDWKWGLAHTYALAGRIDEALKIANELEKRNLTWDTWCLAVVYAAIGDGEKVFYWLEQAYQQRHPFIQWIGKCVKIYFGAFQDDPRFKDLAQRLNLPE